MSNIPPVVSPDEWQSAIAEFREKEKELLLELLGEQTVKRLTQIGLQVTGPRAVFEPDIAAQLNVDQNQMLRITKALSEEISRINRPQGIRDFENRMDKYLENVEQAISRAVLNNLTADQRKAFKTMQGKPIEFTGNVP